MILAALTALVLSLCAVKVEPQHAAEVLALLPLRLRAERRRRERAELEALEHEAAVARSLQDIATSGSSPYMTHTPTVTLSDGTTAVNEKQALFLGLDAREALYGGAAGGGKSDALLMAALQYVHVPGYAALILRRTSVDLKRPGAILDRALQWLAGTDAKYNSDTQTFTFPSGARLEFGGLDRENDKYKYQGAEFQFVGFDELTQFSETQYLYLHSRLRRLEGSDVPIRMRAASNPGGVGHLWVKARFSIKGKVGHNPDRPFVPALATDNPALDVADYEKSLAELDYITREQLRAGDWDIEVGSLFKREWWQRYDVLPPEALRSGRGGIFVDTAHEEGTANDYSVILVARAWDSWLYVTKVIRAKMQFPELLNALRDARAADPDLPLVIEDTSGAKPVIQTLRRELTGVINWKIEGRSKTARAQAASPTAESRCVFLPAGAPWVGDFIDELAAFRPGEEVAHDDQVDAFTMMVLRLVHGAGSTVDLQDALEDTTVRRTVTEIDRAADERSEVGFGREF